VELLLKSGLFNDGEIPAPQLLHISVQHLGNIGATKGTVIALCIGFKC
jgi:hypothetical protein